jgi:hypothetical protein
MNGRIRNWTCTAAIPNRLWLPLPTAAEDHKLSVQALASNSRYCGSIERERPQLAARMAEVMLKQVSSRSWPHSASLRLNSTLLPLLGWRLIACCGTRFPERASACPEERVIWVYDVSLKAALYVIVIGFPLRCILSNCFSSNRKQAFEHHDI